MRNTIEEEKYEEKTTCDRTDNGTDIYPAPANVMTSYADVGDAPTYIYADEDDDQLFVYWDEVDWDDGFMEESIAAQRSISDYDLDYYEVYCKYPNKADYELVKKVEADDDEYHYYDEYTE